MISIFMIAQKPADTALDRVHAQINRQDNLVPMFVNPSNGRLKTGTITLGARADSYYEYLLKLWIQSGKKDEKYVCMSYVCLTVARFGHGYNTCGYTYAVLYIRSMCMWLWIQNMGVWIQYVWVWMQYMWV